MSDATQRRSPFGSTWIDFDHRGDHMRLGVEADEPPFDKNYILHFVAPTDREMTDGEIGQMWAMANYVNACLNNYDRLYALAERMAGQVEQGDTIGAALSVIAFRAFQKEAGE